MIARILGAIVVLLVLFAIVSNPSGSAATTRNGVESLGDVGSSITVFLSNVVNDLAVSTGSEVTTGSNGDPSTYPDGGVETGDGSTPIDP